MPDKPGNDSRTQRRKRGCDRWACGRGEVLEPLSRTTVSGEAESALGRARPLRVGGRRAGHGGLIGVECGVWSDRSAEAPGELTQLLDQVAVRSDAGGAGLSGAVARLCAEQLPPRGSGVRSSRGRVVAIVDGADAIRSSSAEINVVPAERRQYSQSMIQSIRSYLAGRDRAASPP